MATAYVVPHFPVARAMICLDCSACFEVGEVWCPGCSGSHIFPLAKWLDRIENGETH